MGELPISLLLGALSAGGIILVFLAWLVWRAPWRRVEISAARMIGLQGKAATAVATEGRVMVQGEYWWARTRGRIAEGECVRVVGIEGMTLEVEPCPDKFMVPRQVSAVVRSEAELP
jgi:membrane-bound serine protease (ClpP class)